MTVDWTRPIETITGKPAKLVATEGQYWRRCVKIGDDDDEIWLNEKGTDIDEWGGKFSNVAVQNITQVDAPAFTLHSVLEIPSYLSTDLLSGAMKLCIDGIVYNVKLERI